MLLVLAPVAGTVRALTDLPDAVFADGLLGPGLAIDPASPGPGSPVHAPVTGEVVAARGHAFVARGLVVGDGRRGGDVLVHLGLDSLHLADAFAVPLTVGDRLHAGAPVGTWAPAVVVAAGHSPACAVVALQADPATVRVLPGLGARVAAGEPVLEWDVGPLAAD